MTPSDKEVQQFMDISNACYEFRQANPNTPTNIILQGKPFVGNMDLFAESGMVIITPEMPQGKDLQPGTYKVMQWTPQWKCSPMDAIPGYWDRWNAQNKPKGAKHATRTR
jgi:hypothetical protein